jgi:two-component system chemotaxis response regulator CheY
MALATGNSGNTGPAPPPASKRILVVEDSGFYRRALELTLRNRGFEVLTALDGYAAATQLQQGKFDLVLMDLFVPKMNGMALLRMLRSNPESQTTPVIVLSSHKDPKDMEVIRSLGVKRILCKTDAQFPELTAVLDKYIAEDLSA